MDSEFYTYTIRVIRICMKPALHRELIMVAVLGLAEKLKIPVIISVILEISSVTINVSLVQQFQFEAKQNTFQDTSLGQCRP